MKILLCALILLGVVAPPARGQAGVPRGPDRKAPARAVPLRTDHLVLVTYATNEVVTPGTQFSLMFEITPRPRMHVYAPGAHSYQVIRVRLNPNPRVVVRRSSTRRQRFSCSSRSTSVSRPIRKRSHCGNRSSSAHRHAGRVPASTR